MKFRYDVEADALYIRFQEGSIEETEEVYPGDVILDFADNGSLLGLEILNVSSKLSKKTLTFEFEIPDNLPEK